MSELGFSELRGTLIGRGEECGEVERLLENARSGSSGSLVVRGEPGIGKRRCWSTPRSARTGCWCYVRRASTPSPTSRSPGFMGWCARCSPSSDNCSSRRRRRSPARSGSRRRPIRIDCLCRRRHVGQRLVLREYQLRPLLPRGSLQARGEPQSSPWCGAWPAPPTQAQHDWWRDRYKVAADDLGVRPKIHDLGWHRLRANVAALVDWVRICHREGRLGKPRRNHLGTERKFRSAASCCLVTSPGPRLGRCWTWVRPFPSPNGWVALISER